MRYIFLSLFCLIGSVAFAQNGSDGFGVPVKFWGLKSNFIFSFYNGVNLGVGGFYQNYEHQVYGGLKYNLTPNASNDFARQPGPVTKNIGLWGGYRKTVRRTTKIKYFWDMKVMYTNVFATGDLVNNAFSSTDRFSNLNIVFPKSNEHFIEHTIGFGLKDLQKRKIFIYHCWNVGALYRFSTIVDSGDFPGSFSEGQSAFQIRPTINVELGIGLKLH